MSWTALGLVPSLKTFKTTRYRGEQSVGGIDFPQVVTTHPSCYGEYNPIEVLLGRLKWSEVPLGGEVVSDMEDLEPDEETAAEYK